MKVNREKLKNLIKEKGKEIEPRYFIWETETGKFTLLELSGDNDVALHFYYEHIEYSLFSWREDFVITSFLELNQIIKAYKGFTILQITLAILGCFEDLNEGVKDE